MPKLSLTLLFFYSYLSWMDMIFAILQRGRVRSAWPCPGDYRISKEEFSHFLLDLVEKKATFPHPSIQLGISYLILTQFIGNFLNVFIGPRIELLLKDILFSKIDGWESCARFCLGNPSMCKAWSYRDEPIRCSYTQLGQWHPA